MAEISILFVDDEKLIRNSFTRELRTEGFTVTAVASGSEAINEVEKKKYDLVITDLMMPGVDGFAVLKAAKKNVPQTGVIILTSFGDMQSAIDALRLGADDFILKPCEIEELVFRIRHCLGKQNLLQVPASHNQQI
ncbi:MAG: response regulator receiver protein [uncultured bacterium]|nr:MAG: response regulator receiver protein [uncultured bacterium]